ncbi:MAG: sulfatase [Rubripirellula sp.]
MSWQREHQISSVSIPTLLLAITLLGSYMNPAAAQEAAMDVSKPNFIVVFCDNLGFGDIEPYGSTVHRTPHLNRMAKEGRKFTHFCVTAGVCTPSRSSLITGCYSQRVGMHDNPRDGQVLRPLSPYGLNPDEITIAEVLRDAGYATGMVGKWHLGDQKDFLPTRQGFDWFYGIPYSDDMTAAVGKRLAPRFEGDQWPPLPLMENESVIESPVDRDGLTKRYTERSIDFIRDHKDEPFFLYLPQAMPGSTRTPFASPQFKGKSKNGPWGDSIEELDWSMGQILDELVRLEIDRRTLVVWTSDNGAPMDRDMAKPTRGTNRPLHGRGYTTSEGAFRVPTIMWWPETVPSGSLCEELATTMDLLPTFAKLSGGKTPDDRIIDGKDISDLIRGIPDAKTPHDAFFYYERDQLQAVRSGPWKLFVPLDEFTKHPHFRAGETAHALLFNVVTDISCDTDVADKHPEIVERLMNLADQARHDLGDRGVPGTGQRRAGRVNKPVALSVR